MAAEYKLAAEYWAELRHLQLNHNSSLAILSNNSDESLDENPMIYPIIDIDLNSRAIDIPLEFQDFLSVEKEHQAETVFFRVDRYFDGVDLSRMMIIVEYINHKAEDGGRIFPVILKDIMSEKDKMIFAWTIGAEATKVAGELSFAIRFYAVDEQEPIYIYNLATLPVTVRIAEGIGDIAKDELVYDFEADTIRDIYARINQAKYFFWIDL